MKKNVLKFLFLFSIVAFSVVVITANVGKTKVKSYYSGDAISYRDKLVVASTDSEALEVFTLESDGLKKQFSLRPFDKRFNKDESFYSVKLNIENGQLYAYTISGYTLYKYNISDLKTYNLVKENKNTYWEWYNKVDKFGDNIVTISAKGVKIFNNDLEVIDSFNVVNDVPNNISSAGSSNFIFNLKETENKIEIFDRSQRKVVKTLLINFYGKPDIRSLYYNNTDKMLYFADNRSVKKVDTVSGALKNTFEHLGYPGYDVRSSGNEYVYFANGLGVVKLNRADMSVVTSRRTGSLTVKEGWAMGLKVAITSSGEKLVVFNNSSIIVMDGNLKVLGYAQAGLDDKVYAKENLFLRLSDAVVNSGTQVEVSGGGYLPNENLIINFYNQKYYVKANNEGRFSKTLNIPSLVNSNSRNRTYSESTRDDMKVKDISEKTDIKVDGEKSNYTYSISIEIKDSIIEK